MKAKSMKLRMLVTLHALYKHSDAQHRMNTKKLNEYLRPFGLNCTSRVLSDTVRIMREYGIDVRQKGEWDSQGVWIEDRPFPLDALKKLIFAVTTNPHLTKEQATEILSTLKPVVTEFQENLLQGSVETNPSICYDQKLYNTYSVILEAIQNNRRVAYTVDYLKYNKEEQCVSMQSEWNTLFTPKHIYQTKNNLYMVGYNNTDKKITAVNLKEISSIKLSFKHKYRNDQKVQDILSNVAPEEYIPGENKQIIYKGPVEFYCRGQFIEHLYHRFGPPDAPIKKSERCRAKYYLQETVITSETLFWLSQIKDYGIRIKGPKAFREAVRIYYADLGKTLTTPSLKYKKTKEK